MRIGGISRKIATDFVAGYHTAMKRSTLKLAIRRETLRFLTEMEIFRVAGGNPDVVVGSDGAAATCPNAVADSASPVNGCPYVLPG